MEYLSFNKYLKDKFGQKIYKISLDGGFTCPNRDGKTGTRGCIFCSKGGSGDFAESREMSITKQIERGFGDFAAPASLSISKQIRAGQKLLANKRPVHKYIAYFQAFTNTYAPVEMLRQKYEEAINHSDIVALSIATRPDCLGDDVLRLLDEMNKIKPVFVELGLQTIHQKSAKYIRRGYDLNVYDKAVRDLKKIGVNVVVHVILGLPNESENDMLETVKYVCESGANGIKLQLLHVIDGTDLAKDYEKGLFKTLEFDEYVNLIVKCVKIIPKDIVIHRLTGDGAKKDLIAPLWSADKKRVLNAINKALSES